MRELTFDVEQRIANAQRPGSRQKENWLLQHGVAVCALTPVRKCAASPPLHRPLAPSSGGEHEHNNALAVACALNSNVDLQCEDEPYALQYFYITL